MLDGKEELMNITVCPKCFKVLTINNVKTGNAYFRSDNPATNSQEAKQLTKMIELEDKDIIVWAWCKDHSGFKLSIK